jgi:hypothetical protein
MDSSLRVPIYFRITLISLALLFCYVPTPVSAQQTKPDLSGTWKLKHSKSKLDVDHPILSDECKINHSEPRLVMVFTFPQSSMIYSYMTDGEERVANSSSQNGVTRAKAYWDGDTLVIEGRNERSGDSWTARYPLSQDGRNLVVARHLNKSSFHPASDELIIFGKRN